MAIAPTITIPVKANPARLIGTIDIIVRHLSALREELLADAGFNLAVPDLTERPDLSGSGGAGGYSPPIGDRVTVT